MNNFTPQQQAAIATSGNLLVMAGAGTGKTRTLVERCVTWLLDPVKPGSLDRLLMVTFTEAAAAEMRKRIRERLEKAAEAKPSDWHLGEQLALLDTARIQTLHSFCLELVRRHFLELGIDPQVRVLEPGQAGLLARETFDRLLQAHLEGESETALAVQSLLQERARGWNKPLRNLVFRIYAYAHSLREPERWWRHQWEVFENPEPTAWHAAWREGFAEWRAEWLPVLRAQAAAVPFLRRVSLRLETLGEKPARAEAASFVEDVLREDEGDAAWPNRKKGLLRKPVGRFFDEADFWESVLVVDGETDPLRQDWDWVRPQMMALLHLVHEFSEAFRTARRQLGALDFTDLEQYALRLLVHAKPDGSWEPTPAARDWRELLECVFVDEYQDINEVQDAILCAVGREPVRGNRFLVGDVKQSIYRFRLADPRIFQRYVADWRGADGSGGGRVVPLSENFRSHGAILEAVNSLFADVMDPAWGGVAYDEEARLQLGAPAGRPAFVPVAGSAERVELHLRLKGRDEGEAEAEQARSEESSVAEREDLEHEARLVGLRLLQWRADPQAVWDETTGQVRAAEWSDMVVLLRAPRAKAEVYAREFARLGIPLASTQGGFHEALEISDLVNLLRLLDNPLQDIPLLAVLRSPLVGLAAEELAEIRLALPRARFWTALQRWLQTPAEGETSPGRDKAQLFLARQERWRALARHGTLAELLEQVLDETGYADWCLAQERGRQRWGNVQRLMALTRQFDLWQGQGLYRFLRQWEARLEAELEWEPASLEAGGAVRLMSVHQSKGLEAPIVVVADLGRRFNLMDLAADVILDETLGLCPRVKPPQTAQRYASVTHWLAARRQRQAALGEEVRLFYVACTRAAQRLMLVGTIAARTPEQRWTRWQAMPASQRVGQAAHWLDWLGPWLWTATGRDDWWQHPEGQGPLLRWLLYGHDDERLSLQSEAGAVKYGGPPASELGPEDLAALDALTLRLRWRYPHPAATREPAKTSVSAWRRRQREEEDTEQVQSAVWVDQAPRRTAAAPGGLSAVEIGVAHHLFLQEVRLELTSSEAELRAEAERMEKAQELSSEELRALDYHAILAFWRSEVGMLIRTQRQYVEREMPFTLRVEPAELAAWALAPVDSTLGTDLAGEFVIVQGIVDLAVLRPDEIWLLDFKTDAVRGEALERRAAFHAPQVRLYAKALERIFGRPVTRRWLHFLGARRTVEVEEA